MAPGTIGNSENSRKIRSHAMIEEVNSRRARHEVYGPAVIVTITF